mmetsp:Transcript_27902/g.66108  ORF Transcript_27902/g.66108 Transcript_27902/m.66108 type:complete len:98 (-) Transcript_27902:232-525(-)
MADKGVPDGPIDHADPRRGPANWERRHIPVRQDGPPKGGYPTLKVARNLPPRGPSPMTWVAGLAACTLVGFWQVGRVNRDRKCVLLSGTLSQARAVP